MSDKPSWAADLPHVPIDSTPVRPAALVNAGHLSGDTLENTAKMEPATCCPNCRKLATHVTGSKKTYEYPTIPGVSLHGIDFEPTRFSYTLNCGCRVTQEWAAALQAELNSRREGNAPKAVVDMTLHQRRDRLAQLTKDLTRLYEAMNKTTDADVAKAVEYRVIAITDQMMRLFPGQHNTRIDLDKITPEARKWCIENGLCRPREVPIKPGTVMTDERGTPVGIAMASNYPLVNERGEHVGWSQGGPPAVDVASGERIQPEAVRQTVENIRNNMPPAQRPPISDPNPGYHPQDFVGGGYGAGYPMPRGLRNQPPVSRGVTETPNGTQPISFVPVEVPRDIAKEAGMKVNAEYKKRIVERAKDTQHHFATGWLQQVLAVMSDSDEVNVVTGIIAEFDLVSRGQLNTRTLDVLDAREQMRQELKEHVQARLNTARTIPGMSERLRTFLHVFYDNVALPGVGIPAAYAATSVQAPIGVEGTQAPGALPAPEPEEPESVKPRRKIRR